MKYIVLALMFFSLNVSAKNHKKHKCKNCHYGVTHLVMVNKINHDSQNQIIKKCDDTLKKH